MTSPRRRLVRSVAASSEAMALQVQKLRVRLEQERSFLSRWMSKLKRAFHVVEKSQQKINRFERQISKLEGGV
jgi:hypothetical protein